MLSIASLATPPSPPPCCPPPRARLHHQQQGEHVNDTKGVAGVDFFAEESDSQAWNTAFTKGVLAESVGLVDRPTAVKGADGKWEGVGGIGREGRKTIANTIKPAGPLPDPGGTCGDVCAFVASRDMM